MPKVIEPPTLGSQFYREVELDVGVELNGERHRLAVVGPETTEARHAAMANRADWIDLDLARTATFQSLYDYYAEHWDEKRQGKLAPKPTLTDAELAKGLEMQAAWYEWSALHRVVRLGTIPKPQVREAALLLVRGDVMMIARAAEEVDLLVSNFPRENKDDDHRSGKSGDGGDTDSGSSPTDI